VAMVEISAAELQDIYKFAVQLGKDAGKILLEAIEIRRQGASDDGPDEPAEKMNAVDIVTQTDHGKSRQISIRHSLHCELYQYGGGSHF
jgi:hypothetical protein